MLLGALVIVAAWVLTWIYVRWANTHYDALAIASARCEATMTSPSVSRTSSPSRSSSSSSRCRSASPAWAARRTTDGGPVLHRRPQRHGVPERPRARRRLHERRELPRHRRPRRAVGLRRPDLLDRLARRLAGRDVPDRRAAAQSRPVHVRRRRRRPAAPDAGAHRRGDRLARGRRVLSDRADGRRRQPDPAALRPAVRGRGRRSSAS